MLMKDIDIQLTVHYKLKIKFPNEYFVKLDIFHEIGMLLYQTIYI